MNALLAYPKAERYGQIVVGKTVPLQIKLIDKGTNVLNKQKSPQK